MLWWATKVKTKWHHHFTDPPIFSFLIPKHGHQLLHDFYMTAVFHFWRFLTDCTRRDSKLQVKEDCNTHILKVILRYTTKFLLLDLILMNFSFMEVKLHDQTALFQPLFLKLTLNKSFEYFRVRLLYKNWKWMDCYDICMVNFGLTWIDIYGWVMKWTQKFFGTEYLRRVPSVEEFPKDSVNNWVLHG